MTLSRGAGICLWRQVAQSIESDIASGQFPAGVRLPSEAELALRFDVNRHTVRRAVSDLEAAGLVRAEQGRGTFVREHLIEYPIHRRTRFRESLERQARDPGRDLLRAAVVVADAELAERLAIDPGASVELLELAGTADGRRISVASHYFPSSRFAGIARHWDAERSITGALRHYGVEDYTRRSTRVLARPADASEQRVLALARHRPILVTESVNIDTEGNVIEYGVARLAADLVQLVFET